MSITADSLQASFDLTDRVAIVTGASRGIGRSIAHGFAAAGARVVVSSRKPDACDAAVESITAAGGTAAAVPGHMGQLDSIANLVAETVSTFGGIDIIVNNAANALALPVGQLTEDAWSKTLDTNLRGPVFLVQEALEHLRGSDHASVINVLSGAAYLFSGDGLMYAVAKAGLGAATRSLAAALARDEIRVNALVPGTVDTDMVRNMPEAYQESAAKASLMGRAADPDELVGLALLLASDAGSFMTGQTYFCDGGQTPRA